MHLAIDVREACAQQRTGKGQWTYGFVSELLNRNDEVTLFTDRPLPAGWMEKVQSNANVSIREISATGLQWHRAVAQQFLKDSSLDIYVSPVSYIVPWIVGRKKKVIPVVHDLIAFMGEPHDRKATFIEKLTLRRAVFSAMHVCTVSDTTKQDLLARYKKLDASKVTAIFAGPVSSSSQQNFSDGKTIFSIGTLCPRKNQLRLIEAFSKLPQALREKSKLILAGKRGWNDDEIVERANNTPGVEWRQYLSDSDVSSLMQSSAVLAFPSLYEGFGMPVLDAMRVGLPVLTSNRGSLKEVAGDAAFTVNPDNTEEITAGLQKLLEDAQLRQDLAQKGKKQAEKFSWTKTVDLFLHSLAR